MTFTYIKINYKYLFLLKQIRAPGRTITKIWDDE